MDVEGPLTVWLESLGASPSLVRVVDILIEPAVRLAVVVVAAWLATRLIARAIGRAVARERAATTRGIGAIVRRLSDGDDRPVGARRSQRAEALGALAVSVARVTVWTLAVIVGLSTLGVEVGPLVAGAGVVGVALGFGAQDLVKDVLAGVSMLLEDQFGVGDVVDLGDAVGVVEGLSLRTTRVRDLQGTLWHVPNGSVRRVGNLTQGWSRAVVDLTVDNDADLDRVTAALVDAAAAFAAEPDQAQRILEAPEVVGIEGLGAEGVTLRVTVRTHPGEQWAVTRALRRTMKVALDEAGVTIAVPRSAIRWSGQGPADEA